MQTFVNTFVVIMACASVGLLTVALYELMRGKRIRNERGNPNFRRTMGLSLATMVIYVLMIAGVTFVLFDESKETNNHVQAGNLSISAEMVSLEGTKLGKDGLLKEFSDTEGVDLNEDASSIFSIDGAIPGQTQTATVQLNNMGQIAFEFAVLIVDLETETAQDEALARQIRITIEPVNVDEVEGEKVSFLLSDYELETSVADFGYVLAGGEAIFKVTATFENSEDNNAAQQGKVLFDIQIRAVQSSR